MKTIQMGLNTEPRFKLPERFESIPEENKKYIKIEVEYANKLKKLIEETLKEDGECYLSWSCEGRTRHQMHSQQWKEAMPEYDFEIGYNYHCIVRNK